MSTGGAFGADTISPFRDTFVLLLNIQNASRSGEATGRLDGAFSIERHWTRTQSLLGDGLMRCCLLTYQARGFGDPTHSKYEHGSTNEVGD